MTRPSMKSLCESAAEYEKISNKAELAEALKVLIQLQDAQKSQQALVTTARKTLKPLVEACAKYALEHPSIFDEGLLEKAEGVLTGDVTIDGQTYHFVNGCAGYERGDGQNINQTFLKTLPVEWTRQKIELDTTGIKRARVGDDELGQYGLQVAVKNEWSEKID